MAPKKVSIGIHVPAVSETDLGSGADYAAFFRTIEDVGLDSIWVEDRIFHRSNMLDGPGLLFWAAANTRRVRLGTAVMVLNVRNAAIVARQASTLSHLSGGRLTLGVSLGGRPNEYLAAGVDMKRRPRVLEQSIANLRALLSGEPVTATGAAFPLDAALVKPAADVPIYLGGRAEPALERAGRLGDGWIMGPFGGAEDFKRSWGTVREAASAAGRDADALEAGRLIYVAVDDDRSRARDRISHFIHSYYDPAADVDTMTVYGPAGEVASRLRELVDLGMRHFMLGVPTLDAGELERIAKEVAPVLRAP